jgi:hypothetical protein
VTLRPAPIAPRRSVGVCRSQSWVETSLCLPKQQMHVKLQGVSSSCSSQHPYCRKGTGRMQSSATGITASTIGQSVKYIENPRTCTLNTYFSDKTGSRSRGSYLQGLAKVFAIVLSLKKQVSTKISKEGAKLFSCPWRLASL